MKMAAMTLNHYGFNEAAYNEFLEGMADRYDLKEKKKKGKSEKMCAQYRPWAPPGMQHAVVPCKELGLK